MKRLVLLFVVAGAAFWLWQAKFKKLPENMAAKTSPTLAVTVVPPEERDMFDSVEALGTAYAAESVEITASASEHIDEINFTDGQTVRQGDVIVQLRQEEEKAALEKARARLTEMQSERARLGKLLKDNAASKRDYEALVSQETAAEQDVAGIEAQIAEKTITAPFDGVLGVRRLSAGALVRPGDLITTIDAIHEIKLDFTVPSVFLSTLKAGDPVEAVTDALSDRVFEGRIESINTRVDPITRSVLVRAIIPNDDAALKPGLLMRVRVRSNPRRALVVPEEALLQKQDRHMLLVVTDPENTVAEKTVAIGTRLPGIVEVREGLSVADRVITRGISRVRAGQKVSIAPLQEGK